MVSLRIQPEPELEHANEVGFVDQVLKGWASWARNDGIDLRPTSAGDLWQIQAIIEARDYVLMMKDDDFVLVDQRIAQLPNRLKVIVFIEYASHEAPREIKAREIGLTKGGYRQRLHAAQWTLFSLLMPVIDTWRRDM